MICILIIVLDKKAYFDISSETTGIHKYTLPLYLQICHTLFKLVTCYISTSKVTTSVMGHRQPSDSELYLFSLKSRVPESS